MPETPPVEPKAPVDELFDIGNTDRPFPPASDFLPPKEPERPRNADGTFAKTTPDEPEPEAPLSVATPEAPPDLHREALLSQAEELGYRQDELQGISTGQLGVIVARTYRQIAQRQPEPAAPKPPEAEVDDLPINEEELHPELVKALKVLKSARSEQTKEIKALKEQLAAREKRDEERAVKSGVDAIDVAIDSLDAHYKAHLGEGSVDELKAAGKSIEFRKRVALLKDAGIDMRDLPSLPILKKKLKESAEILWGVPPAKVETPKVDPEIKKQEALAEGRQRISQQEWANAGLGAPTNRQEAEKPGRANAIKKIAEKQRANGQFVAPTPSIEDELGELPD